MQHIPWVKALDCAAESCSHGIIEREVKIDTTHNKKVSK